ncbi:MAG: 3-isopropylmalate dehydratase small subunit [Sphingomonadales bacterium]|nr:3-isopropylmalate dehydratase small subunit [Sphingomonadales bacterium]
MRKFLQFEAVVAPLPLANVDTDQILPARFLKTLRRSGLGQHLFADLRFDSDGAERPDFVLNQPAYRDAGILVAHDNFGSGSSREHAPWALADFGNPRCGEGLPHLVQRFRWYRPPRRPPPPQALKIGKVRAIYPPFRQARDLEEGAIERAPCLPPIVPDQFAERLQAGNRHHGERGNLAGCLGRDDLGDDRAPVMADQMDRPAAQLVDPAQHVLGHADSAIVLIGGL